MTLITDLLTDTLRFNLAFNTSKSNSFVVSDKIQYVGGTTYNTDYENIQFSNTVLYIRINKSKLTQYGFIEGTTSTYIPAFIQSMVTS